MLKATQKLHESVQNCEEAIRIQIEHNLKKEENQFKRILMEQNLGEYASEKDNYKAIPATYRRERGTDRTAASIGCIRYKDLRKKDHEAAIVVELGAREIVRTSKDGWKIKLDVLKGNERDQHSFEPKSSIEAFLQINS